MKLKFLLVTGLVLTMLVATSGCIFSPDPDEEVPQKPVDNLKYPSNADIVMKNFEIIYEDMLINEFREMLHVGYKTILLEATMEEWSESDSPLTESYFTRDEEITIHENIFNGITGVNAAGDSKPPVSSIDVAYLEKPGSTWEPIPESDPDFAGYNGYYATFDVLIYFLTPDNFQYEVSQKVEFYVAPVDDNGQDKFLLLGQRGMETK